MRETYRFNPWRRLRALGPTWKLKWSAALPADTYGHTDWGARTITLREGMSFEERRSTITHEVQHVLRGPASIGLEMREELIVDRIAARMLIPNVRRIGHAMAWHRANVERAAHELWVDERCCTSGSPRCSPRSGHGSRSRWRRSCSSRAGMLPSRR